MYKSVFLGVIILATIATSAIIPDVLDNDDFPQGSIISPTSSYAVNSSNTYGNVSVGDDRMIQCDKIRYGRDLNIESCRKSFSHLDAEDPVEVYADRGSAQPHDVGLPQRITSSKCHCTLSLAYMVSVKRTNQVIR